MEMNPFGIQADDMVLLWSVSPTPSSQSESTVVLSEPIENFRFYFLVYAIEPASQPTIRLSTGLIPRGVPTILEGFNLKEVDPTNYNAGLLMFRQCGPISGTQFHIGTGYYTEVNTPPTSYGGACVVIGIYGVR